MTDSDEAAPSDAPTPKPTSFLKPTDQLSRIPGNNKLVQKPTRFTTFTAQESDDGNG
jgi:hypothetical protein